MGKTDAQRQPLKDVPVNRKRGHSEVAEESEKKSADAYGLAAGALTPPHSFTRRSSLVETRTPNDNTRKADPLSPEMSSPIKPQRAKRLKSDQGRSSGINTVEEFLEHLSDEARLGALQDPNRKPPYSYAMMIVLSILQSDTGKLTLSQIYYWISSHFPYYKPKDSGWQNSIRHNLSLNEAFVKGGKSLDGKGHFWEIKPGYESKFFKNDANFSIEDFRSRLHEFKTVLPEGDGEKPVSGSSANRVQRKGKANSRCKDTGHETESSEAAELSVELGSDTEDSRTSLVNVPSSPQAADYDDIHVRSNEPQGFSTIDKDFLYYEDEHLMKRQDSTHFGGVSKFSFRSIGSHHDYEDLITAPMSSPSFKKYSCSFNTSFEPVSPVAKLEVPQVSQQHSKTPVRENTITPLKFNIFSTPQSRDNTSVNFPGSAKVWQSPSKIFDDYFTSPVFLRSALNHSIDDCMIQFEQGKRSSESPRKLSLREQTPYMGRNSQPHGIDYSKFSSNSLFGVDVCSVWKRAIAHCNSDKKGKGAQTKNDLAPPFDGTD